LQDFINIIRKNSLAGHEKAGREGDA